MDEKFTFWEEKSIKLPVGPVVTTVVVPVVALILLAVLSSIFGAMQPKESRAQSGPTMEELTAAQEAIGSGDAAKMSEMITGPTGQKIGADADRWRLVSRWKNQTLFELYQTDLLGNINGQITGLQRAMEAEKAAQEKAGSE